MKTSVDKTARLDSLTDDVLCALVARNEVRKARQTPQSSPASFLSVFHDYSNVLKGKDEKSSAKLEKERKMKLTRYVYEHLAVKDEKGEPTDLIITE